MMIRKNSSSASSNFSETCVGVVRRTSDYLTNLLVSFSGIIIQEGIDNRTNLHPKKKKGYYSGRGDKMHETNGQNKHVSGGPFPSSLPSSSNSSSDGLSSGSQCSISTTSSYNSHSSSRSASSFSAVIPQATSSRQHSEEEDNDSSSDDGHSTPSEEEEGVELDLLKERLESATTGGVSVGGGGAGVWSHVPYGKTVKFVHSRTPSSICSCFSCGNSKYSNTPSRRTSVAGSVVSSGLSRSGGSVTDFEDNGSQYTGTDCDDENHHRSIVITDRQLNEFYQVQDVLGEGSFSTVYLAESTIEKGGFAAIKVVQKGDLIKTRRIPKVTSPKDSSEDEIPDSGMELRLTSQMEELPDHEDETEEVVEDLTWLIDREIRVMYELDNHPHIIRLEEVFDDQDVACFVMELAKGGEVFHRLLEKEVFEELEAADMMVQLLGAVQHMHQQGIVHRDLKLENLLYYDDSPESKIMVADFGLSEWESSLRAGDPVCGTPGYISPEVVERSRCTTKADVWALGVIAYTVLAGYPPFFAEKGEPDTDDTVLRKIVNGQWEFHARTWAGISEEAKDFIRCLLKQNPNQRPSCAEALQHTWIVDRRQLARKRKQELKSKKTSSSSGFTSGGEGENSMRKSSMSVYEFHWSWMENLAFAFSMAVLLSSYTASVLYIFRIDTGMMTKLGLDWTPTHQELAITTLDSLGQHFGPWLHAGKLIFNSWLLPSLEQLL